MKSYECSKFIAKKSTINSKRCAILRDEQSKIKNSILNEIKLRYDTANEYGHLDKFFEKQENSIKNIVSGFDAVFTMGFRATSNANTAGLKSVSDVDIAVIEEAEDIRDVKKYRKFADGIRKPGYLIIIILNTPDLNHWIVETYFNREQITFEDVPELYGRVIDTALEGYYKLIPVQKKGFVCIQTSYKDNPYLPEDKVEEYKNYGNPDDRTFDLHHYLTDICGFSSSGRKGLIFPKAKAIKLEEYLALPFTEYYGLDFGTSSPAGLVGVKFDQANVWCRELNYAPLTTMQIGKLFCTLAIQNALIVADSADPRSIIKLRTGWQKEELTEDDLIYYPQLLTGFNVFGAAKGADSIKFGIDQLNTKNLFIVEESVNFWKEQKEYAYAVDRNNNPTDMPIDGWNHLFDPLRYVYSAKGSLF